MKKSFDFTRVNTIGGEVFRPILAASVEYEGRKRPFNFVVDSGADFTLLSRDCAVELGMSFDGFRRDVHGICGQAPSFQKKVRLTTSGFEEKPFDATVYACRELKHNLLGRDNFFHQYLVGFDGRERKLYLDDRRE